MTESFEAFAASVVRWVADGWPITDDEQHNWCFYCDAEESFGPSEGYEHEHDCIWVRCRRRCGLPITAEEIEVPGPPAPDGTHRVKPWPSATEETP